MRSEEEYQAALRLIEEGINDSAIGRALGVPRTTVRDWREGTLAKSKGRTKFFTGNRASGAATNRCPVCESGFVDAETYAYLLGIYLGDGCLSPVPRGVHRLRVSCDLKYPDIINEIATSIVITRGVERVGFVLRTGCVEVYAPWRHWICLFPQHGPGRKHDRRIELIPWQQTIVDEHPTALIRGLIHSDGSRHTNTITRRLKAGPKTYRYPRYMFTNASSDIMGIFTSALDTLGVHWTRTSPRDVAVSRCDDVEFLDTFVGPKS